MDATNCHVSSVNGRNGSLCLYGFSGTVFDMYIPPSYILLYFITNSGVKSKFPSISQILGQRPDPLCPVPSIPKQDNAACCRIAYISSQPAILTDSPQVVYRSEIHDPGVVATAVCKGGNKGLWHSS